jgi:hypothetical protein
MAGSYLHAVNDDGQLRNHTITIAVENVGDAWETLVEFYGMVWYLANGDPDIVETARQSYRLGIEISPGIDYNDGGGS